jgi:hypothetical protein
MRTWSVGWSVAIAVCAALTGPGVPPATAGTIEALNITGTATCPACTSTASISGSFTVDLTTGLGTGGTVFLSDSADLASSPLGLSFTNSATITTSGVTSVAEEFSDGGISVASLIFPFSAFPSSYSGGSLCTGAGTPGGCSFGTDVGIGPSDESLSLSAATGGLDAIFHLSTGSVSVLPVSTVPEPSTLLLLTSGFLGIALLGRRCGELRMSRKFR